MDANPYSVNEDPQTAEWVKKYHIRLAQRGIKSEEAKNASAIL